MMVAASHKDEQKVKIYIANYRSGFLSLLQSRLPIDAILSNSFSLLDTSEDQVFLFVENHGVGTPFGNIYISGDNGMTFSLSMENVIRGEAVDFEKMESLDGTYIINKYAG